jgi:hypothetical protein
MESTPVNNVVSEKNSVYSTSGTKDKAWHIGIKRINELEKSKKNNLSTNKWKEKIKSAKTK